MVNETYARPDTRQVTTAQKKTWAFNFVAEMEEGDTIVSGSAVLRRINPVTEEIVPGFVVGTPAVVGTTVQVSWDARYLRRGEAYELSVNALLSSGEAPSMVAFVEATA